MKYQIWYMRPEWFREGIRGEKPDPANLDATHIRLKDVPAMQPFEIVYTMMQGENWSPNGEARPLIEKKGLSRTSMSVGDVIVDETGQPHIVAKSGFEPL